MPELSPHALWAAHCFAAPASPATALRLEAFGSGHIHDTYLVSAEGRGDAILQRLNTQVFPDPDALMSNIERVCSHLRAKLEASGVPDVDRRCVSLLRDADGGLLVRDPEGGVWRGLARITDAHSHDVASSPSEAYAAARAFGAFALALEDLPGEPLTDVIEGFHDTRGRLNALEATAARDPRGRRAGCRGELDTLRELYAEVSGELSSQPRLRNVHNDCKLNNLLVDRASGEALSVIDLDTVMRGALRVDFGELARTASCRAAEDERDLSLVVVDEELLEALCEGYAAAVGSECDAAELTSLAAGPALMALENAVRFLEDHLAGDQYFKLRRPGQNLDRARVQARLARQLLAKLDRIERQLRSSAALRARD